MTLHQPGIGVDWPVDVRVFYAVALTVLVGIILLLALWVRKLHREIAWQAELRRELAVGVAKNHNHLKDWVAAATGRTRVEIERDYRLHFGHYGPDLSAEEEEDVGRLLDLDEAELTAREIAAEVAKYNGEERRDVHPG